MRASASDSPAALRESPINWCWLSSAFTLLRFFCCHSVIGRWAWLVCWPPLTTHWTALGDAPRRRRLLSRSYDDFVWPVHFPLVWGVVRQRFVYMWLKHNRTVKYVRMYKSWATNRQWLAILFFCLHSSWACQLTAFFVAVYCFPSSRFTFVFAFARTNQFLCICLFVVLAVFFFLLAFSFINLVRCMEFVRSKTCHAAFRLAAQPPPSRHIVIAIRASNFCVCCCWRLSATLRTTNSVAQHICNGKKTKKFAG